MKTGIKINAILMLLSALTFAACGGREGDDASSTPEILIDYSTSPDGGDNIYRGFYIESYPGTSISSVTLWFHTASGSEGDYTIQLEARANSYDGELLGQASEAASLITDPPYTPVIFNFNNVTVAKGTIIAFKMSLASGSGTVRFSNDCDELSTMTPAEINVIETGGTAPPIDSFRRDGIAIQVIGLP